MGSTGTNTAKRCLQEPFLTDVCCKFISIIKDVVLVRYLLTWVIAFIRYHIKLKIILFMALSQIKCHIRQDIAYIKHYDMSIKHLVLF